MKRSYALTILRRELKMSKRELASQKDYYRGYETMKEAKRNIGSYARDVASLENAIEVLKTFE